MIKTVSFILTIIEALDNGITVFDNYIKNIVIQ